MLSLVLALSLAHAQEAPSAPLVDLGPLRVEAATGMRGVPAPPASELLATLASVGVRVPTDPYGDPEPPDLLLGGESTLQACRLMDDRVGCEVGFHWVLYVPSTREIVYEATTKGIGKGGNTTGASTAGVGEALAALTADLGFQMALGAVGAARPSPDVPAEAVPEGPAQVLVCDAPAKPLPTGVGHGMAAIARVSAGERTGFAVAFGADGHLLTGADAVGDAAEVTLAPVRGEPVTAAVVAVDAASSSALLHAPDWAGTCLAFAPEPAPEGSEVWVLDMPGEGSARVVRGLASAPEGWLAITGEGLTHVGIGAPVLDLQGQLVGITRGAAPEGAAAVDAGVVVQGLGFELVAPAE